MKTINFLHRVIERAVETKRVDGESTLRPIASFLLQAHFAMIVIPSYVIMTRKKMGERTSFFTRPLEFLRIVIQIFRAFLPSRSRNCCRFFHKYTHAWQTSLYDPFNNLQWNLIKYFMNRYQVALNWASENLLWKLHSTIELSKSRKPRIMVAHYIGKESYMNLRTYEESYDCIWTVRSKQHELSRVATRETKNT